jgi:1,4-dihydroxy-2-naphthoyl-CoA hydrolase
MKYSHPMTVRMYDTDAAGILYFGNQFRFVHDTFETIMAKNGFTFQRFFDQEPYLFVIVHAESSYRSSLFVGDEIVVDVTVIHIGTTSFQSSYEILRDGEVVGQAKIVHVCINKETRVKQELPEAVRVFLKQYYP